MTRPDTKNTCLFHVTPARNLAAILKDGLLTPRERARRQNVPPRSITVNADTSDIYSIYLGKREALNYPLEIQEEPLAMLQVCFSKEETAKFLPDDDYVEDFILARMSEQWYRTKWLKWRKSAQDEYVRKYWRKSLDAGYGVRYEGNIDQKHVISYEIGEVIDGKFVTTSKHDNPGNIRENARSQGNNNSIDPSLKQDIETVYVESKHEVVQEHEVIKKLRVLQRKASPTAAEIKAIGEYERIERAWLAIKNVRDKYIKNKAVAVNHDDLKTLERIWKAEIAKYHVGWMPRYKKLLVAIKHVIASTKNRSNEATA
jgi:hypothetical protein